jgi:hypothetical protein
MKTKLLAAAVAGLALAQLVTPASAYTLHWLVSDDTYVCFYGNECEGAEGQFIYDSKTNSLTSEFLVYGTSPGSNGLNVYDPGGPPSENEPFDESLFVDFGRSLSRGGTTTMDFEWDVPICYDVSRNGACDFEITYEGLGQGKVTSLEQPLPAALPLFATGLGALGLFGWSRKRKNADQKTQSDFGEAAVERWPFCFRPLNLL